MMSYNDINTDDILESVVYYFNRPDFNRKELERNGVMSSSILKKLQAARKKDFFNLGHFPILPYLRNLF